MGLNTHITFRYLAIILCCTLMLSVFGNSLADTIHNNKQISEDDRRALLTSISEAAMLPIFAELNVKSGNLVKRSDAFCQNNSKNSLNELRQSWADTAYAWQQADSLLFGPTVDDNIDFTVYFLPIKKAKIKGLLQKQQLEIKDVDAAGIGAQGLGSLEYLLFSRELTLPEIRQRFMDDPKRCHYLLKTTELLNQNISTISRQWQHYGVQFGLAGNNSLFFLESSEAMTVLVNKIYQSSQKVSNKKIGLLSNKTDIKKSTSYKLQAWRSGTSFEQAKANIKGIQRILEQGKVLQWLRDNNKANTAEQLIQLMDDIQMHNVQGNDLFTQLQKSPESLQVLVENTKKLTNAIKSQLAPSLGVELGFNDNDGD